MRYYFLYQTQAGSLWICEEDGYITYVAYRDVSLGYDKKETPLIKKTYEQLMEYFDGQRTVFDIPINASGTAFQKQAWSALSSIPYGETRTYKQIAELIGNPKGCRAVGLANNRNPISIVVPCHRVIGTNGKLVGYAGGLHVKEKLLLLEKQK